MTREVMDDIWTHKFKQLKTLWPELSPRLLRKMRKQVDAAHLKWLESRPKKDLENIQNPVPSLNKIIRSNNLRIDKFKNNANSLKGGNRAQRAAISCALNMANPQQVLEYCQIQESKRVAEWVLVNLHNRSTSIDKLDEQWKQGPIIFGSPFADLKSNALSLVKMGFSQSSIVRQAENEAYINKDLKFLKKLEKTRTSKTKRLKSLDHISDIPIFLCAYWCGFDGVQESMSQQPPPLCFFPWGAIASYLDIILGLKDDKRTSVANVRKYGNRLRLQPVSKAIVNWVNNDDGIYFRS